MDMQFRTKRRGSLVWTKSTGAKAPKAPAPKRNPARKARVFPGALLPGTTFSRGDVNSCEETCAWLAPMIFELNPENLNYCPIHLLAVVDGYPPIMLQFLLLNIAHYKSNIGWIHRDGWLTQRAAFLGSVGSERLWNLWLWLTICHGIWVNYNDLTATEPWKL